MLLLSVQLTLLSLFLMPLFLWLTVKVGKARREVASSTQKTLADMTAITEETLSVSGILLSKSFGRQRHEIDRFDEENERLAGLQIRQTMIGRSFFAVVGTFFSITPALVYLVGGLACSTERRPDITAATIVAFTTLQARLFFPIGSMLQVSTEVQTLDRPVRSRSSSTSTWEHEIMDCARRRASRARETSAAGCGSTTCGFRVRGAGGAGTTPVSPSRSSRSGQRPPREWTLDDVTSRSNRASSPPWSGPSGAGKTTMTYLVPRLYDVQRRARVDRRPRRARHRARIARRR